MPVKSDSRYARQPSLVSIMSTGERRTVLTLRLDRVTDTTGSLRHIVVEGESIDLIAKRYYGDEKQGWLILDANPLVFPLDISAGDVLIIPPTGSATAATRTRRF